MTTADSTTATRSSANTPISAASTVPIVRGTRTARNSTPASAPPTTSIDAMSATSYWLNGRSAIGIWCGEVTSDAQRFCSGSRMPVMIHGSNPTAADPAPTASAVVRLRLVGATVIRGR